jgi:hypothetical protein
MSVYHGKCTDCGEVSSLERIDEERLCFECATKFYDSVVLEAVKPVDQDDARKYDYYSDWTVGY